MRISILIAAVTRLVVGALALLAAPCAPALSLGDAAPQSSLGQPLRVVVPISAATKQTLTAECVHVIADTAGGSGPPSLLTGRVTIDRGTAESQLLFTTTRVVNDPVVRLAVQAGCEGTTRRDYVLLLDPPAASGMTAVLARRGADPVAAGSARVPRETLPAASAPAQVVLVASEAPSRTETASSTPAAVAQQPKSLLSSPGGSSFIAEASAAVLPRSVPAQGGLALADVEPQVAPWWPLAAALLVVAALARWLVPMRRRSTATPAWVAPTARTEPNPSVSGRTSSRTSGKGGHFAAMTEPGSGFPRGASKTERTAPRAEPMVARPPQPPAHRTVAVAEDPRFAEFDADLVEERTIRAEWAKLVNDGAIDMGGDSILKAIDDAERALHGGPSHPAQVALDRSLDDELLPKKTTGR
jgi:hypothetical protein